MTNRGGGADRRRARRKQLRDVVSERGGCRAKLRPCESHDDDAIAGEDEAARVGCSVGDPGAMESLQHAPGGTEGGSPPAWCDVGQVLARHPRPDEHALAVGDPIGPEHIGHRDVVTGGEDECERFVFDGTVGVPSVCGGDRITEREEPPCPVQPVGVTAVTIRHTDVQDRSIGCLDSKRTGSGVHGFDGADVEALFAETGGERLRVGVPARRPEHEMDHRADHPAEREPADHVSREVGAHIDARNCNERDEQPRRPSGGAAEVGAGDRRHRGRDGDVRRRERQPWCHRAVQDDPRDALVGRTLRDDPVEELGGDPRTAAAQDDQLRQPRPPAEHAHQCDHRYRRERSQLHDADEGCAGRVGELVDEPEEVELGAARIRRPGGDRRPAEYQETEPEPHHVARVSPRRGTNWHRRSGGGRVPGLVIRRVDDHPLTVHCRT